MKITVFGAGGIGGHLANCLGRDPEGAIEVSIVARGAHLAAIREKGLKVVAKGNETVTHPNATDDAGTLGPQDAVFVTLKAHQAPGAAPDIAKLLGPDTPVFFGINGIPWWFFHKFPGPHAEKQLKSCDPDGALWSIITPERALACVTYSACEVIEPGVVEHGGSARFILGEPNGSLSERVTTYAAVLERCGIKGEAHEQVRNAIWTKIMGNSCFNPVSALTGGTMSQLVGNPQVRTLMTRIMRETQAVATAFGGSFETTIDERLDRAKDSPHKTSMLQDMERGRPLELDAIVAALCEMGTMANVPTPNLDAVLALAKLREFTSQAA